MKLTGREKGRLLDVANRDARTMHGDRPFLFTNLSGLIDLDAILRFIIRSGSLRALTRK